MNATPKVHELRLDWSRVGRFCTVGAIWSCEDLSDADVSYLLGILCNALGGEFSRVDRVVASKGYQVILGYCEES